MSLLISTNMYEKGQLSQVLQFVHGAEGTVGVELFPLFHEEEYEEELKNCLKHLKGLPISFHGPYYGAEHSALKGTAEYERTMKYVRKTLKYATELNSQYMVFHHSNCMVTEEKKADMILTACKNFYEIEALFAANHIPVVVENAGVMQGNNMLLNEKEFVELCKKEHYQVLIDIGHAHANHWNLDRVIRELKDQIVAYHIHNNDGYHDGHQRIRNGSLNFQAFLNSYKELTPDADLVLEYNHNVADDVDGIKDDIKFVSQY